MRLGLVVLKMKTFPVRHARPSIPSYKLTHDRVRIIIIHVVCSRGQCRDHLRMRTSLKAFGVSNTTEHDPRFGG